MIGRRGALRNQRKTDRSRTRVAYLYVAPAIAIFGSFIAFPVAFAIWLSMRAWDGFSDIGSAHYVGLANYHGALTDHTFWQAARNTVIFTVASTVAQMVIAFLLAFALWFFRLRFANTLRAFYFFPAVVSMVMVGLAWRQLLAAGGPVNELLHTANIPAIDWLGGQNLVLWVIIWVSTWQWTGWTMLLYLAGMVQLPKELNEAAVLDGAGSFQTMRWIVLPQLGHVTALVLLLNIAGGFQVFDTVYVMTGGGPNHASEVLGSYAYWVGFSSSGPGQLGSAATIAVMMVAVLFVFSYLRIRSSRLV